ncbi:putative G-protein coupled receptor 150 [Sigmodon hispidus]
MEDHFSPSALPPAPNLSVSILQSWDLNLTSEQGAAVPGPQPPHGTAPSHPIHLVFMGIILVTAVTGNTTVLCRLCGGGSRSWPGPKRRKMDFLLVQLAAADLYACGGTALSQMAWELLGDPRPALGDLACRFSQLLQASGRGASAHLVALIALERQLAVRRPQGQQLPARALAVLGWLLALLLALPPTFVVRWGDPPPLATSAWPPEHRCWGIFAPLPRWHMQAGDCGLWRGLQRRLGVVWCVREGEAEINKGAAGDHQALHRHRWPHPHYHHARREERDKGCQRPPPPRPRPLPCSCESAF